MGHSTLVYKNFTQSYMLMITLILHRYNVFIELFCRLDSSLNRGVQRRVTKEVKDDRRPPAQQAAT